MPSTIEKGVWCQALSLPWPPVLWSLQPGFRDPCVPGAVGAGVGTQHRPHSVRPCGPALLAVGVVEGRCIGSSDSTQLYTDVIRISMILRCTLVH